MIPLNLIDLKGRQHLVQLVQENVGMGRSEDQSWSQSDGVGATATAIDSFLAQLGQDLISSIRG